MFRRFEGNLPIARARGLARSVLARPGFSLTELLIVLAIIALLIALLLPIFSKMQAQARMVKCAAQMRQVLQAHAMYCDDYDDAKPPLVVVRNNVIVWQYWAAPNLRGAGQPVGLGLLAERYLRGIEPFLDPSDELADDTHRDRENWRNPLAPNAGSSYIYFWQHPADASTATVPELVRSASRQRTRARGRHAVLMDVNTEWGLMYVGVVHAAPFSAHPRVQRLNVGYLDGSVQAHPANEILLRYPGRQIDTLRWFDLAHRKYRAS